MSAYSNCPACKGTGVDGDRTCPCIDDGPREAWITELHLRQPGDMSHEVAYTNALDAAQMLMAAGYDVTLRPTLPDTKTTRSTGWNDDDPLGGLR
jgi:hypothetical protein